MGFRYLKSINEIKGFYLFEHKLLLHNRNNRIELSGKWSQQLELSNPSLRVFEKHIFCVHYLNKNKESSALIDLENGCPSKHLFFEDQLIVFSYSNFVVLQMSELIDNLSIKITHFGRILETGQILWEFEGQYFLKAAYKSDLFFIKDLKQISVRNLHTGELKWNQDISYLITHTGLDKSLGSITISHIMGVWDNILWVNLDDGSFLLLEADTGKFIQNPSNKEIDFYGNPSQSFIDVDNGMVYGIFLTHLSILDIKKVKAVQFDLKDTFSQSNIEARRGAVKLDKWLVFADDLNNKVAAINLETHELDWIWDLPQDGISPNERARCPLEIKGHDNKLYVKDNKNTLHIFEMN